MEEMTEDLKQKLLADIERLKKEGKPLPPESWLKEKGLI